MGLLYYILNRDRLCWFFLFIEELGALCGLTWQRNSGAMVIYLGNEKTNQK